MSGIILEVVNVNKPPRVSKVPGPGFARLATKVARVLLQGLLTSYVSAGCDIGVNASWN